MRLIQEDDIELKKSMQQGAGRGVFAKKRLQEGVILPYFTLLKNIEDAEENRDDDTYFMAVTYVNGKNKPRNITSLIADGNPKLKSIKKIKPHITWTAFVNESSNCPPNCIFVNNSILTKDDIVQAYKEFRPVPITLMVTARQIEKGEELYTLYGGDYERDYKIWRDRKGIKNALIDRAHDIVEASHSQLIEMFSEISDFKI